MHFPCRIIAITLITVAAVLLSVTGCEEEEGPIVQIKSLPEVSINLMLPQTKRHFVLGGVPLAAPGPNYTRQDLVDKMVAAGKVSELIAIRQHIDWDAYRPGGTADPSLTDGIMDLISLARENGMSKSLVELDPVVDRYNVGPLPEALKGQKFSDPSIRQVMKTVALEVAKRGHPDYLSMGVEINGYFNSKPEDFEYFVTLHKEIYDEVKAVDPKIQIMVSFNLESLQGLLPNVDNYSNHGPQWFLIDKFLPKLDAVAFSTLPYTVFYRPALMPDNYISQIQDHTSLPIVLSEVGWTTAAEASSNEQRQSEYLAQMARLTLATPNMRVFAWTFLVDPPEHTFFDVFPTFKYLGLFKVDGTPKQALAVWQQMLKMPLEQNSP